jgi:ribulose-phosphate 3-epimerase
MSVPPGAGGQPFDERSLTKVVDLRRLCAPRTLLSIDGGINPGTIGRAAAAGVDLFVAGSAIFRATDYRSAMSQLRTSALAARG